MRFVNCLCLPLVTMALGLFASTVSAGVVTYVTPSGAANGSSSIQAGTTYTTSLGYAFKTGASGPFDIDFVTLSLTSGASAASASFKISIHGTDNEIAYSAVASSTVHASDTVTVTTPVATNTPFDVTFTSADIPNITNFQLQANTAYSIILNSQSGAGIALRRTQGLADGTTNGFYTVSSGFTMLDTFRNNTPNYSNSAGSYPAFHISFGGTAGAPVPEPTTMALWTLLVGGGLVRNYRNKKSRC